MDTGLFFDHDELLKTLASLIGIALAEQKLRQQEHQIVLFEERSIIGRELHDSLAQSLTYLKFELTTLTKALESQQNNPVVNEKVMNLKDGLSGAYLQLRELLQTFRLSIDTDFETALQNACEEFGDSDSDVRTYKAGGVKGVCGEISKLMGVKDCGIIGR